MDKRVIYQRIEEVDGLPTVVGVSVIVPAEFADCGMTVEEIAAKDVPTGLPYKIVDVADIPTDRTARDLWTANEADLTDGVGA